MSEGCSSCWLLYKSDTCILKSVVITEQFGFTAVMADELLSLVTCFCNFARFAVPTAPVLPASYFTIGNERENGIRLQTVISEITTALRLQTLTSA